MQEVDLILHGRWVIPVEPMNTVYEHTSLIIHHGRIVDILPQQDAQQQYQAVITHSLAEHALIPGLINAHTHASMSLLRGLADDLPLMTWLKDHMWPAEQTWVNEEFVHDGTQLAIAEMLRGGVTCFNEMYFYPEVAARVASQCGIRATIGLIVFDFPSVWAQNVDEYIEKGLALHDEYLNNPLIKTAMAPHAPYTVSDPALKKIQTLSDELEIPIHMHVHETADEIQQSLENCQMRPLQRLHQLGMVSPNLLAVHMTQLQDQEIIQLAENGVHVLHCPESNLKLASGLCPVAKLIQADVNVCLGTDGAASNNNLDMFGEMQTAALVAKVVAEDASVVSAPQALAMATINGARALGLDQDIGSLAIGKFADVTAVRLSDLETQPIYHPISQLVYAASREQVTDVWINGRQLLANRQLIHMETQTILEKASIWRDKIQSTDV